MSLPYRPVRIYQGPTGVWRVETERNGKLFWQSLRTRNPHKARQAFESMKEADAKVKTFDRDQALRIARLLIELLEVEE